MITGRSRGVGEVLPDLPSDDVVQCHDDQQSRGPDQTLPEETRARQNHRYVIVSTTPDFTRECLYCSLIHHFECILAKCFGVCVGALQKYFV